MSHLPLTFSLLRTNNFFFFITTKFIKLNQYKKYEYKLQKGRQEQNKAPHLPIQKQATTKEQKQQQSCYPKTQKHGKTPKLAKPATKLTTSAHKRKPTSNRNHTITEILTIKS
jgi:hypothetical protein